MWIINNTELILRCVFALIVGIILLWATLAGFGLVILLTYDSIFDKSVKSQHKPRHGSFDEIDFNEGGGL